MTYSLSPQSKWSKQEARKQYISAILTLVFFLFAFSYVSNTDCEAMEYEQGVQFCK